MTDDTTLCLTIADLAAGLSHRAHLAQRYSEDFVRSFFKTIEEGLLHDNIVRIKGLGTFKLVGVETAYGTGDATGDQYEMTAYTRISFSPDIELRDAVNRPFLEFVPVALNDGTDISMMESADMPETKEVTKEERVATEETEDITQTEKDNADERHDATDEPELTESPAEETTATEPQAIQEETTHHEAEEQPADVTDDESRGTGCPHSHSCLMHCIALLVVALFFTALGYCLAYYWHPVTLPELCHEKATETTQQTTQEKNIKTADGKVPQNTDKTRARRDTTANAASADKHTDAASRTPSETLAYPQVEGGDYWIVGITATEVMRPGMTLLNLSLKYYKSQDLVNYICTMNGITNPDIVPLDKELKIPALRKKTAGE